MHKYEKFNTRQHVHECTVYFHQINSRRDLAQMSTYRNTPINSKLTDDSSWAAAERGTLALDKNASRRLKRLGLVLWCCPERILLLSSLVFPWIFSILQQVAHILTCTHLKSFCDSLSYLVTHIINYLMTLLPFIVIFFSSIFIYLPTLLTQTHKPPSLIISFTCRRFPCRDQQRRLPRTFFGCPYQCIQYIH